MITNQTLEQGLRNELKQAKGKYQTKLAKLRKARSRKNFQRSEKSRLIITLLEKSLKFEIERREDCRKSYQNLTDAEFSDLWECSLRAEVLASLTSKTAAEGGLAEFPLFTEFFKNLAS